MSSTKGDRTYRKVAVNFCRLLLAACFIFSGFVKAVDPTGTQIKLQDYMYAFGMGSLVDSGVLLVLAGVLAGFEFLLGIYMLFGIFRRGTTLMMLLMMLVFTPLTLYLAIKNPVTDCGCFGDALVLTNWQTFGKNVVLLVMAVYTTICCRYIVPAISEKRMWMVSVVTAVLMLQFIRTNVRDLPVFDFRPYKVGTDLRSAVLSGRDRSFDDFLLMDSQFDDMTFDILEDKGYTFLLVASHLEEASDENADLMDDLYDYCRENGYAMYGVTASGQEAIEEWCANTGAEYRFLIADEIPLQTMVRSNPGLVLLHDGVIEAKWSHNNIPGDDQLSAPLEELHRANPLMTGTVAKAIWVGLMFLLPYLLILLLDALAYLNRKEN